MSRRSLQRHLSVVALMLVLAPQSLWRGRQGASAQEQSSSAAGILSFTDVTAAAGMANAVTGSHGAFWADATGDGRPDLFLTYNECRSGVRGNKFYRNLGGSFVEEAGARGLLRVTGGTHGGSFADVDNDGDYDLITGETYATDCVATEAPPPLANRIFRNDGGVFVERTPPAMAAYADYTRSILAFDSDRDGDLDIFAVNGDRGSGDAIADRNELYRNDGGFNFAAITGGALITTPAGQAGTDTDYDGDGDVDIIVPDFGFFVPGTGDLGILRNDGGAFTKVPRESIGITHAATTGITTGDINNDGRTDLILIDQDRDFARPLGFDRIAYIYLNAGAGRFTFVAEVRGIPGYTAGLADLDNDGDLDLVFPGFPAILLNNGAGVFSPGATYATPSPVPGCVSTACFRPDPRTLAFADVDADGDLDFVLSTKFGPFYLFRNNFDAGNWLKVRLTAPNGQAGAFGAKVRVLRAGTESLIAFREAKNVYGYLSQDDPVMHVGLGAAETVDVEVTYLDGSRVRANGISRNRTISFAGTTLVASPGAPTSLTSSVAGNNVTLAWGPPASGTPPTGYVVEAGSAPGLANLALINTPGTGLAAAAPEGTYFVRVKAGNSAGFGPPSNEITVVVGGGGGGCTVAPGAPGPLSFTVAGSLVRLNWSAPASGGSPTTYLVEAGSAAGLANLVVLDVGGPTPTLTANAPPGTYFVRVRAANPCGSGPVSNEVVVQVQ